MIRLILVAIYLILFLVLGIPALLVLWLIGKSDPGRKDRAAKAIVGWGFRCIAFLAGTKLIVRGTENIPADSAVLYVGNHRSYFDIVLTYSHFPGITGYVAKKEMLRWVLLKDWMKAIIEGKKKEPFQITYTDNANLYICIGYGEQETGGYSIAVNELYLTDTNIVVNTSLLGPEAPDQENKTPSSPYIVIKTEYLEQTVTFE